MGQVEQEEVTTAIPQEASQLPTPPKPRYITDHQMRSDAIAPYIIGSRECYLECVRHWVSEFRATQKRMWVQYLREEGTRKPYGLVAIWERDGQIMVAGSALHGGDKWNRHLALFYAVNRANPAVLNMETGEFEAARLPKKCYPTAAMLTEAYIAKQAK